MMLKASLFVLSIALCLTGTNPNVWAQTPDQDAIRNNTRQIAAPGVPGPLCVFGKDAFPVVLGKVGENLFAPVVAGARAGKGRIVVFGHTGYFDEEALATVGTGKMVQNAIQWVGSGGRQLRIGVRQSGALIAFVQSKGYFFQTLDGADWLSKLNLCDVVCLNPSDLSENEQKTLASEIRKGKGLLAVGLGWGWLQLNPGKTLQQHAGNRLLELASAGILWSDGTLEQTATKGFSTGSTPSPNCHADTALQTIVQGGGEAKATSQAVWTVSNLVRGLPPNDTVFLPRLQELRRQAKVDFSRIDAEPVTMRKPLAVLAMTLDLEALKRLPAKEVKAHPAAKSFPGSVPADAPRIERMVTVDGATPDWQSTGLYAPPGEVITITVPQELEGKEVSVRIGAHTDTLWDLPSWERAPEISQVFPLKSPRVQVANAFGGAIYMVVPEGKRFGKVEISIHGAIAAPYFVRGKTSIKEWQETIRNAPAPWAELQGKNVILTVPSAAIRNLEHPNALLKQWDDSLSACFELGGVPLPRSRPERYVCDRQISAGYMHSGYPIMMGLDVQNTATNLESLKQNSHDGIWGFWHEVGHNLQEEDWTFEGTGEVTCNVFALYVFEKVCGFKEGAHPAVTAGEIEKRTAKYFKEGVSFEKWKDDPFLALTLYIQLQRAFGWDAYKKVFAEYRALPAKQRPGNDQQKRDQWMTRFSRTVGKNLAPFFQAWGVPVSEAAQNAVSNLPKWMPPDFPPNP